MTGPSAVPRDQFAARIHHRCSRCSGSGYDPVPASGCFPRDCLTCKGSGISHVTFAGLSGFTGEGRGGFWNRAGRRSGGASPIVMDIPNYAGPLVICEDCQNARIPLFVTSGCSGCRRACDLVNNLIREAGGERQALELLQRASERTATDG